MVNTWPIPIFNQDSGKVEKIKKQKKNIIHILEEIFAVEK